MRSTQAKIFLGAYWLGILGALAIMYADAPRLLFVEQMGHMAVLVLLGLVVPRHDRPPVGMRVQTAGYLHTLIGFAAALLLVHGAGSGFELGTILPPLGSALGTSIIGWFFGGEIEAAGREGPVASIEGEMDAVAAELRGFSAGVRKVHEDYIASLRGMEKDYKSLHEKNRAMVEDYAKLASSVAAKAAELLTAMESARKGLTGIEEAMSKSGLAELPAQLKAVSANMGDLASGISEAAGQSRQVAKYLGDSRLLVEELGRLIDFVQSRGDRRAS